MTCCRLPVACVKSLRCCMYVCLGWMLHGECLSVDCSLLQQGFGHIIGGPVHYVYLLILCMRACVHAQVGPWLCEEAPQELRSRMWMALLADPSLCGNLLEEKARSPTPALTIAWVECMLLTDKSMSCQHGSYIPPCRVPFLLTGPCMLNFGLKCSPALPSAAFMRMSISLDSA